MARSKGVSRQTLRLAAALTALGIVSGCAGGVDLAFLQPKDATAETAGGAAGQSVRLIERDVEAPEVFQVTEAGLWDGRPSLGGVWVAHPDVSDPERVIIRNTANDKFVIGALFRREREIPGPRIQASSDAAAALGMLAGAPVQLNVTALRREQIPETPPPSEEPAEDEAPAENVESAQSSLDPIADAAAAIDAAEPQPKPAAEPAAEAKPEVEPAAARPGGSRLAKPYIQIGIFNIQANANRTADQMRGAGMVPTILEQSANGKPFWRVVVGPARTSSERATLLGKIRETGFSDAYPVSN